MKLIRGAERFYALRETKQAKRSTKAAFDRDSVTIHAESCAKKISLSRTPQQIHHPSTGFQHPPSHYVLRRDKSAPHTSCGGTSRVHVRALRRDRRDAVDVGNAGAPSA